MLDAIFFEKRSIPAAVIVTEPFIPTALGIADLAGMPGYPHAVIAHPVGSLSPEEVGARADAVAARVETLLLGGMARVPDPAALVAALGLYFGEGRAEGYRPGSMADGPGRVRKADPARADGLIAEIETLWQTASSLPGLWGEHALPLEEACERVERFLETEYPMIPAPLRRRIVNAVGYHLWK